MEDKIYQILKTHRLPLKKREELIVDLLALFSDSLPEMFRNFIRTEHLSKKWELYIKKGAK